MSKLIDPASRRLLDRLRLAVTPRATAARQGGHRSPVLASGLEFADHRQYVAGDDVRQVDWKAFARHRQLTIRQFEEERDARVYVLCDLSSSMTRGEPPKLDLARRLSAAFSYVGAKQFDAVQIVPFTDDAAEPSPTLRHRERYPEVEKFLLALEEGGTTSFPVAVRTLATRHRARGLVVVVTNLMTPTGWSDSFRLLGALGHQLSVVRVTCVEDDKPDFRGEIELADSESGERIRLRMNRELLAAYRQVVAEHVTACRDAVVRVGGRFVEVDVATPGEKILRVAIGEAG